MKVIREKGTYLININKPVQHVGQHLDNHVTVIGIHPLLPVTGSRPR